MFKLILIIAFLLIMLGALVTVVFAKHVVSGVKSKNNDVRIEANKKLNKVSLIAYLTFIVAFVLLLLVLKIF